MKKYILILGIIAFSFQLKAQEIILENLEDSLRVGWWKKSGQIGANFSQASFNDSWQGGGVSNFSINFLFNYKAIKYKGKGTWTNEIQTQYGLLNNKGDDLRKSIDRIFLESKYSQSLSPKINWYTGAIFLSQFAPGYEFDDDNNRGNMVSTIFAPAFLTESIGFEWVPTSFFTAQFGAGTIRQTFVLNQTVFDNTANDEGKSYGVSAGEKLLNELGLQGVLAFDKDLTGNLNLKWRYQGFYAYAPESKPIDHNINLTATVNFAKYFNVNFTLIGIYDTDQIESFQLSQGLSAGFSLTL